MNSKEWIELFFSESFEKQINDLILEDIDFEIPRESILNYVLHIIDVPYTDYLDYAINLEPVPYDKFDIPCFDKYEYCEQILIDYLISQDNKGCTEEEIGKYLADGECDIKGSTTFYGSRHLYSAKILGLVYEYYNHWYLSCIGYVFNSLSNKQKNSLMARTILRSPFYKPLFSNLKSHVIYIEDYMRAFSDRFIKMHLKSMMFFSDICVKEAHECNIVFKIKSSSKKYKTIGDVLNIDTIIPNNASKSLKMYFKELRNYPIINEFEIRRLIKEYRNGNNDSLCLIVKASQLTVIKTALSFKYAPFEDIIQEGNIGVMNAIKYYDFERKSSYYGYLSFWVKRIIQSFSLSYPNLIHIPSNKFIYLESFEIRVQKFLQIYEFMPPNEMFTFEGISEKERKNTYDLLCNIHSMIDHLEEEKLYAEKTYSPDYNLDIESLKYRLNHYLYFLSDRERDIIISSYNLNSKSEMTISDIANKYNKSRERIRQILEAGTRKLRILYMFNFCPSLLTKKDREYVIDSIMMKTDKQHLQDQNKGTEIERNVVHTSIGKKSDIKKESTRKSLNHSANHITQTPGKTKRRVRGEIAPIKKTLPDAAKIGDRIMYDNRCGTVIDKRSMAGILRLIIQYDNGTYGNVPDDTNRYRIF